MRIKLSQSKEDLKWRVKIASSGDIAWQTIAGPFDTKEEGKTAFDDNVKRLRRNAHNRAKNKILQDLCGTSARAARMDMGI